MKREPIFVIGASGHAKVIIDIIEKEGKYEIAGLIDSFKNKGDELLGYTILGKENEIAELAQLHSVSAVIIAIGDNWTRHLVMERISKNATELKFASVVHPSAQIAKNVQIGEGVVIMAGAVVNTDSVIGDFTIINTKASIDHDGKMMPFSSVAPGVTAGGNVTIGSYTAISIGATIKHNITIGQHALIGAGAVLLHDCADNTIMYGVPAKTIKTRNAGDRYL